MSEEFTVSVHDQAHNGSAALAGEYLRAFAGATRRMGDFDDFYEALRQLIHEDTYFAGAAEISGGTNATAMMPDFESLDSGETVIPVTSAESNAGYLKYAGRRDGEPFGAEDLHLMGSIAGFVSVLTAQAHQFRRCDEKARVFQYLINQLPLGVICFDEQGGLLVENKLAVRLLGHSGAALIRGALSTKALKGKGRVRLHFEVEGKLLYTEGRRLDVDEGLSISAFVLHDMSAQREKHLMQLERSVYRAESRGTLLTVGIFEDRSEAGRLYGLLKASADCLQLGAADILALDAYACACVFAEKRLRSVRYLLKNSLPRSLDRESVKGALFAQWSDLSEEAPAQSLIDSARASMQPLSDLLRPALLVLDPYPAVLDSLEWIGAEIASFTGVMDENEASAFMETGEYDGLFLDIDAYGEKGVGCCDAAAEKAGSGFRVFYLSHKQPSMVYTRYQLGVNATVLQKPFDTEKLRKTLALQFDFT